MKTKKKTKKARRPACTCGGFWQGDTFVHAETCKSLRRPYMVECEDCAGSGKVQMFCSNCGKGIRLVDLETWKAVEAGCDDLCKACQKTEL